jgi:hypothetical protein
VAEGVENSPAPALTRAGEPPGKYRNRLLRYQARRAAARTTRDLVKAATDYFWGTFAGYSPAEIEIICDRLVEYTDSEKRRTDAGQ